jgi:hypothetical protein
MSLHWVFQQIMETEGRETSVFAIAHVLTKVPLLAEGRSINRRMHYVHRLMKCSSSAAFKTGCNDKPDHHDSYGMPISSGMWIKMSLYSHLVTSLTVQSDQ